MSSPMLCWVKNGGVMNDERLIHSLEFPRASWDPDIRDSRHSRFPFRELDSRSKRDSSAVFLLARDNIFESLTN